MVHRVKSMMYFTNCVFFVFLLYFCLCFVDLPMFVLIKALQG